MSSGSFLNLAFTVLSIFLTASPSRASISNQGNQANSANAVVSIKGQSYNLIPEILSLSPGALVPSNVYSDYDSRLIGATIVGRLKNLEMKHRQDDSGGPTFINATTIQLAFRSKYIASIVQNGFLNQHQIGHSEAALLPEARAASENLMASLSLESRYRAGLQSSINRVRPIYAYLMFNKADEPKYQNWVSGQYGNVIAVMKDEIKYRSTLSGGDSLIASGEKCLTELMQSHRYVENKTCRRPNKTFFRNLNSVEGPTKDPDYWESQIWGGLDVSDVDHFLVRCPPESFIPPEDLATLTGTGVPIFNCEKTSDLSHFQKTTLVSEGDPMLTLRFARPLTGAKTESARTNRQ